MSCCGDPGDCSEPCGLRWTAWSCLGCKQLQVTVKSWADSADDSKVVDGRVVCHHKDLCPEQVGERPRCWNGCWINEMGYCRLKQLRALRSAQWLHEHRQALEVAA